MPQGKWNTFWFLSVRVWGGGGGEETTPPFHFYLPSQKDKLLKEFATRRSGPEVIKKISCSAEHDFFPDHKC